MSNPDFSFVASLMTLAMPAADSSTSTGAVLPLDWPMSVLTCPGCNVKKITLGNSAAKTLLTMLTAALEQR